MNRRCLAQASALPYQAVVNGTAKDHMDHILGCSHSLIQQMITMHRLAVRLCIVGWYCIVVHPGGIYTGHPSPLIHKSSTPLFASSLYPTKPLPGEYVRASLVSCCLCWALPHQVQHQDPALRNVTQRLPRTQSTSKSNT